MPDTQCKTCVMDNSAAEFTPTATGCNFCDAAKVALAEVKNARHQFKKTGKEYDCLIGLSGGADSSYALHLAVTFGLKPLCFTLDNGWNDPVADENVLKLVEALKVPLYRYVIDTNKFKELQAAFLKAGVKNIEIPTDHVLMAASLELASKYGIKTIISGGNVATESIMPASWGHNARDLTHIKAIWRRHFPVGAYGPWLYNVTGPWRWAWYKFWRGVGVIGFCPKRRATKALKKLPLCGLLKWNYYRWIKKIKTVYILDHVTYNREAAIQLLGELYDYKHPGEKHEESVWTRWFQNFYLFEKFGIDKRKAHLSSLVVSGQLTRDEALERLTHAPVYPELGIEQKVMKYPRHEHEDFPMDKWYGRIASLVKLWKS